MTDGLTQKEVEERLQEYGPNELEEEDKTTSLDILERQFKNLLVWILLGAAIISFIADKVITFYFITVIIAIIILMGFIQEWKAEKAVEELKQMVTPKATVIRDGEKKEVPSTELVPGDVVKLEMGDKIPADGEVMEKNNLKVNEAILTGESEPVKKSEKDDLYSGTTIVHGRATMKVTDTGMESKIGEIAEGIQIKTGKTPLQKRVDKLSMRLAGIAIFICIGIFILGISEGVPAEEVLLVALALIVATVPEALPLTLTLTLSAGVRDMAKRNAITRKMLAVEALGSTTTICTDKTGTLTKNEMTVKEIHADNKHFHAHGTGYTSEKNIEGEGEVFYGDNQVMDKLIETSILCNNADFIEVKEEEGRKIDGDPTEASLLILGEKAGVNKEEMEEKYPREDEILFTSERKRMTTIHQNNPAEKDSKEDYIAYTKGAPEIVLERCTHILEADGKKELTEEKKKEILNKNKEYAQEAMRVLAFAYKDEVNPDLDKEEIENGMTFIGLAGMIDPPRQEVEESIEKCRKAGIDVKMVTGDNPDTAQAIAKNIGLTDNPQVITGKQLEEMNEEELHEKVMEIDIYARTQPEQKLRIVKALQENGEVAAMTGDGINDAPAVKEADVGVGMGVKGTDVTKEASDIILEDDDFGTIVNAVEDGRRIYDNIEKFTTYLLSRNFTEIMLIIIGILTLPLLFGVSGFEYLPLIALQILFINVIGEEMPAISLGLDPAVKGIMKRPPRDPSRRILNKRNSFLVVSMAIFMAIAAYTAFIAGIPVQNLELSRTMAFSSIVLMVIVHTFNFRSLTKSITEMDLLKNKLVILSIIIVTPLLIAAVHQSYLAAIFKHYPMSISQWIIAGITATATFGFIEIIKHLGKEYD